jgi:hypothetical protein
MIAITITSICCLTLISIVLIGRIFDLKKEEKDRKLNIDEVKKN